MEKNNVVIKAQVVSEENASNDHNQELDEMTQESPQPLVGPNDHSNPAKFKSNAPTESSPTKNKSCNSEIEETEGESSNEVKAAASCRSKNEKKIMKDEDKIEEIPSSTFEGFTGRTPLPRKKKDFAIEAIRGIENFHDYPESEDSDVDPSYVPSAADKDRVEQSDLQSDGEISSSQSSSSSSSSSDDASGDDKVHNKLD